MHFKCDTVSADPIQYLENPEDCICSLRSISLIGEELCPSRFSSMITMLSKLDIFGIIRYRTESMPVREMTYLFAIIAISVINALGVEVNYGGLIGANLLFVLCIWLCESNRWLKHVSCKLILYDRIELIKSSCEQELIADIKARTGLKIIRVEVGYIDFLRDAAMLKIYYEPMTNEINTIDTLTKIPRGNE